MLINFSFHNRNENTQFRWVISIFLKNRVSTKLEFEKIRITHPNQIFSFLLWNEKLISTKHYHRYIQRMTQLLIKFYNFGQKIDFLPWILHFLLIFPPKCKMGLCVMLHDVDYDKTKQNQPLDSKFRCSAESQISLLWKPHISNFCSFPKSTGQFFGQK